MSAPSLPHHEGLYPRRAFRPTHGPAGEAGSVLCVSDLSLEGSEVSPVGAPQGQDEREARPRRSLDPLPVCRQEPSPGLSIRCDDGYEDAQSDADRHHQPARPDSRSESRRDGCGRQGTVAAGWHAQLASMQPALMRTAKARLRNQEWAADAVSLVMVAAIEQPPPFDEPGRVKAWLFGILRNKLVDVLRQQDPQRVQHYGLDPEAPDDGVPVSALTDASAGPERHLAGRRFLRDLDAALLRLPPLHRRAFWLQDVLGEETGPTCDTLGISPNHLGVCLYRARARLRQMLVMHAA